MNRVIPVSLDELDLRADPATPQEMLPPHLREKAGRRELLCRKAALRHGMGMLSQKERQALHMRYDLGMNFRTLSNELGVSQSAAQRRVARSQETLKTFIELCLRVEKELSSTEDAQEL